ncbi:head morphogenesis protein [Xanthomonas phage Pfeifenkraut]|uniref:Head morphogenesis protein n=1 Tax=Xanthomonas phage Pfeifenkraut TaxID=2939132 RepID=A0A9E7J573_9CAUD|nr:head morphogenesis protein [Xanthomonas phage Pfeifenkraut]URA06925.1 head morphogenesis protein [Xanthomonas phage Pfeifenkraut]
MAITESGRLFDVTTRLALFVENVKLGQMQEFNAVLAAVEEDLRKTFARVNYKTLDGLSKAELNRLLLSLRKSQLRIYSAYTEKLIKSLQEFMQARLDVSAIVYGSIKHGFSTGEFEQFSEKRAYEYVEEQSGLLPFAPLFGLAAILPSGSKSLWSVIKNAPIPANGLYVLPFIQTFARSAQSSVENTIRKAYANRQTVAETLAELAGQRAVQGHSTQLAKIRNQANAVIETAFAHVDQISASAIVSAIYSRYMWLSVIDGNTTQFCRDHDGRIFRYGAGPIPPAHYKCRSVTVPLASQFDDFSPPTLYAWLKRQPRSVQAEFIGKDAAALLSSGQISSKDFASLIVGVPMQLKNFKSKVGLILST